MHGINCFTKCPQHIIRLYELDQWKQIEQENIDILQSYKTIATSKFKNGTSPMTDVLRVDIMLKDATHQP